MLVCGRIDLSVHFYVIHSGRKRVHKKVKTNKQTNKQKQTDKQINKHTIWRGSLEPKFEVCNSLLFSPCVGNVKQYLGMENGDIPDANIMASHNGYVKGRLHGQNWCVSISTTDPWIHADIGYQTCVSGVVTQGDGQSGAYADWVSSFWVSTFETSTASTQVFVKENGVNKVSLILFSLTIMYMVPV